MLKRGFDILFSFIGIILLSPLFIFIIIWIVFDSRGGAFYLQTRVGRRNGDFKIFKFRTMFADSDKKGLLTVGSKDYRITRAGIFLRKYKIDELPQLANVLIGDMSFVGPRPEVRKYVEKYNSEQMRVLDVRPGITDVASIEYIYENELLGKSSDPEATYIKEVMPAKLRLNLEYINNKNFFKDILVIARTLGKIIR